MRLTHEHLVTQRMKAPLMRSLNGIELLNLIGEHGPISRASLAKLSHLSKPTVSSQVDALIRQGLAVELGQGESGTKGGKKPTLVGFQVDAGRLYAAEINAYEVRVAVADLAGTILDRSACAIGKNRSVSSVLKMVRCELRKFIDRDSTPRIQRIISVAANGRVDARRGVVIEVGNVFNWRDVPIRAVLEKDFGIPVFVDNNVRMATLGEIQYGVAQGEKDVVVVRLDTGIGCGIVVRGRLVHGGRWAAGEIAHMILDTCPPSGDWRLRGYLEAIVGSDCILSQAQAHGDPATSALDFLASGGAAGPESAALFNKIVRHLGIAIANLISVYDPSLVVLQGSLLNSVGEELRRIVTEMIPWGARIAFSEIGDEAVLLGTVVAARRQAYDRISRLFDENERDTTPAIPAAHVSV